MNEVIVDKTRKENIHYVENSINLFRSQRNTQIRLEDMYDFVKEDLALANHNAIKEEEDESSSFDFLGETITLANDDYVETEIGFLGQDLKDSTNPVTSLVVDYDKADRFNVAITCNQNNYINVLAGALKQAIKEIELLKEEVENLKST